MKEKTSIYRSASNNSHKTTKSVINIIFYVGYLTDMVFTTATSTNQYISLFKFLRFLYFYLYRHSLYIIKI